MNKEFFNKLIESKTTGFYSGEPDFLLLSKYKHQVKDKDYFDFVIESNNGGFFYNQSLHVYSYSHNREFNDIEHVNIVLQEQYGDMAKGLVAFAQDLFGNQFCFDIASGNRVVSFNTETGRKEDIAEHFMGWLNTLYQHFGYYIGLTLMNEWRSRNSFTFNQRLCPKVPFISSGDFTVRNLHAVNFPAYIEAYAAIARQVHHFPEGTTVKIAVANKTDAS